jgi:hypothetical protein
MSSPVDARNRSRDREVGGRTAKQRRLPATRLLPYPLVREATDVVGFAGMLKFEGFLSQLLALLETDQERARVLLRRYMPPLVLTPLESGAFKVTGGFDLEATLEPEDSPVRASNSRRDPYSNYRNGGMWVPAEAVV